MSASASPSFISICDDDTSNEDADGYKTPNSLGEDLEAPLLRVDHTHDNPRPSSGTQAALLRVDHTHDNPVPQSDGDIKSPKVNPWTSRGTQAPFATVYETDELSVDDGAMYPTQHFLTTIVMGINLSLFVGLFLPRIHFYPNLNIAEMTKDKAWLHWFGQPKPWLFWLRWTLSFGWPLLCTCLAVSRAMKQSGSTLRDLLPLDKKTDEKNRLWHWRVAVYKWWLGGMVVEEYSLARLQMVSQMVEQVLGMFFEVGTAFVALKQQAFCRALLHIGVMVLCDFPNPSIRLEQSIENVRRGCVPTRKSRERNARYGRLSGAFGVLYRASLLWDQTEMDRLDHVILFFGFVQSFYSIWSSVGKGAEVAAAMASQGEMPFSAQDRIPRYGFVRIFEVLCLFPVIYAATKRRNGSMEVYALCTSVLLVVYTHKFLMGSWRLLVSRAGSSLRNLILPVGFGHANWAVMNYSSKLMAVRPQKEVQARFPYQRMNPAAYGLLSLWSVAFLWPLAPLWWGSFGDPAGQTANFGTFYQIFFPCPTPFMWYVGRLYQALASLYLIWFVPTDSLESGYISNVVTDRFWLIAGEIRDMGILPAVLFAAGAVAPLLLAGYLFHFGLQFLSVCDTDTAILARGKIMLMPGCCANIMQKLGCCAKIMPERGWCAKIVSKLGCCAKLVPKLGCCANIMPKLGCCAKIMPKLGCCTKVEPKLGFGSKIMPKRGCCAEIISKLGCCAKIMPKPGFCAKIMPKRGCCTKTTSKPGCCATIVSKLGRGVKIMSKIFIMACIDEAKVCSVMACAHLRKRENDEAQKALAKFWTDEDMLDEANTDNGIMLARVRLARSLAPKPKTSKKALQLLELGCVESWIKRLPANDKAMEEGLLCAVRSIASRTLSKLEEADRYSHDAVQCFRSIAAPSELAWILINQVRNQLRVTLETDVVIPANVEDADAGVAAMEAVLGDSHAEVGWAMAAKGKALLLEGDYQRAADVLSSAVLLLEACYGQFHVETGRAMLDLIQCKCELALQQDAGVLLDVVEGIVRASLKQETERLEDLRVRSRRPPAPTREPTRVTLL